jgi:hypothetical protein
MSGVGQRHQATAYADAAELEEWLRQARVGDEVHYAFGPVLNAQNPTAALVKEWLASKEVVTFQRRGSDGQLIYCARRRDPANDDGAPGARVRRDEEFEATAEGRVFLLLVRCANMGLPCPSNRQIADHCDLRDAEAARYRFNNLIEQKRISVRQVSTFGGRVVTICATGRSTSEARRPSCA